jgi:hypothetical protein
MTASTSALTTLTVTGSNFSTGGGYLRLTDPASGVFLSTAHPERVVSVTTSEWKYQVNNGGAVGTWQVQVINADGQTSNAGTFNVTAAPTSAPAINSVSPPSMTASTSALTTLTVTGSNFSTGGGYLRLTDPAGGVFLSTAHPERVVSVTPTEWRYQVNNGGAVGTWQVRVVNADGQTSNAGTFNVTAAPTPAPAINSVSPSTMLASTTTLTTLTVSGSNFSTSGGSLRFTDPIGNVYSSTSHPERVVSVSSTQWQYQINNGGAKGTWQVRVVNADGQTSNAGSFTVF